MKKVIFGLLFVVGCAATVASQFPQPPPSVGFTGRVRIPRKTFCVFGEPSEMTRETCDLIKDGIAKINHAAGQRLLLDPVEITMEQAGVYPQSSENTFFAVHELEGSTLGQTAYPLHPRADGNIAGVVVVYDPIIFKDDQMAQAVIVHELFHSVGADHADQNIYVPSCQVPGYSLGVPTDLSPADVVALRAAYPLRR